MLGIINIGTFIAACIIIDITPGNDTIFVLSKSITQGRKAGIVSSLGIGTGLMVHTTLVAFGLAYLLAQHPSVFNAIKVCGGLYLLYIGLKMFFGKNDFSFSETSANRKYLLVVYRDAILTNLLNPKASLFFLAFMPQFVDIGYENTSASFLLLGAISIFIGVSWCMVLVFLSTYITRSLNGEKGTSVYLKRVCGTVLVSVGLKVLVS